MCRCMRSEFSSRLPAGAARRKRWPGPGLLTEIAESTGGRHFPVENLNELPDVAAKIGIELRNQYVLGYTPTNTTKDGKYRRVQVKLKQPRGLPPLKAFYQTWLLCSCSVELRRLAPVGGVGALVFRRRRVGNNIPRRHPTGRAARERSRQERKAPDDCRARAFKVYENNVEQPIKTFRREDVPVSLGLVIDNSGSMRNKRKRVEAPRCQR